MGFASNPYTTGGLNPPKGPDAYRETVGVTKLQMEAACKGTTDNQPNVNPVDPGSHHASGAGVAQANKP